MRSTFAIDSALPPRATSSSTHQPQGQPGGRRFRGRASWQPGSPPPDAKYVLQEDAHQGRNGSFDVSPVPRPRQGFGVRMPTAGRKTVAIRGGASCTSVDVSGVGDFLSGTYRQSARSGYDAAYYSAGGLDYYWMSLYNGAWTIEPGVEAYPEYQTEDPSLHPTDISLTWTVCDAVGCEFTPVTTDVVITCAATCDNVVASGAGLSSGTYRQAALSSIYDEAYYMAGGVDYYYMYKYDGAWYMEPQLAGYPILRTFDDAVHPVDVSLEWGVCDSTGCDYVSAASQPTFACAGSTSSSDAAASTCDSVVVSGAGVSSGTYRQAALSSIYDEAYYMAGGVDYYYMYKYDGAWYIEPQIAGYPLYRTFDDAVHPVDITLEWTICDIQFCDHVPAPSPPSFLCATTCTIVTVSGVGDLDGDYDETYVSSIYDESYTMPAGVDTNIIYKSDGAWYIEPQDAGYPQYRTYDDATHPADVSLEWTLCDIQFCDHTPAPAPPTIGCADGSPLSTPAPNSITTSDDLTSSVKMGESTSTSSLDPTPTPAPSGDPLSTTTSSDPISPTPTSSGATEGSGGGTPAPSVDSRAIGDDETISSAGGSSADLETEETATGGDDGGEDGGLSIGGIIGIIAAALVTIAGGGFAFAFKNNSIHCCQRHQTVNNHAPKPEYS
eukprot:g6357.t1